jgi:Glycosyl transferase family 90
MVHGSDENRQILLDIRQDPNNDHRLNATSSNLDIGLNKDSFLSFDEMAKFKYQLDIGGELGTTWGGLRWKMCPGNLVFKVDTFAVDWWHHTIQPWLHYIPVHSNMSNLYE